MRLFPTGTGSAYSRYANDLSSALMQRDWVYDPSFALQSDWAIYEKVLRDPIAAHAIRFRQHLVAGHEWRVEPSSEEEIDQTMSTIVEGLIDNIQNFTDARLCLANAIFRGSSYAFIEGQRILIQMPGDSIARSWWVPLRLVDVDRRRFRLARDFETKELGWQLWSVERQDWEPLDNPQWFVRSVFQDTEDSLGYGRGMLDTLYYFQANKARVLRDAMSASARFGKGMVLAAVDQLRGPDGRPVSGEDGSTVVDAWKTELARMSSEHAIVHDSRDKVSIVQGIGEGFNILTKLIDYLDAAQVTAVLGSTVATMKPEGGSFALAKEQADSTEALVQADRERLSEDITRDLIGLIMSMNKAQFKDAGLAGAKKPRFKIHQAKAQDPTEQANIAAVLLAAGIDLRKDEVYEKTGYTMPGEDDEVISGTTAPAAADPFGAGFKAKKNGTLKRFLKESL